jgi:hypothetical protein
MPWRVCPEESTRQAALEGVLRSCSGGVPRSEPGFGALKGVRWCGPLMKPNWGSLRGPRDVGVPWERPLGGIRLVSLGLSPGCGLAGSPGRCPLGRTPEVVCWGWLGADWMVVNC